MVAYCSGLLYCCLLYTSDAADERSSVDLGGRRIIKKKKKIKNSWDRDTKKIQKTRDDEGGAPSRMIRLYTSEEK